MTTTKNLVEGTVAEGEADIIIEVAVPAQTTVELCSTEAANIMNKEDTIAIFGSNQVSAEGVLTANNNLNVLGSDPEKNIIAAGFDAGSVIKSSCKRRYSSRSSYTVSSDAGKNLHRDSVQDL